MTSLTSLAEKLLAQAKLIDQALEDSNRPYTSFDEDTLESLPDVVQELRWELLDTSHTLRQLVRGPRSSGLDIAFNWTDQLILRIIWRYKLASAVPLDGSASYRDISIASGLSEPLVVRVIRAAISMNIFDENEQRRVRHTAISRLLVENEGYYQIIGLQLEDIAPASLKLIEAWEKFGDDVGEPDQSAWSLNNQGRSLFTCLSQEPDRAYRFDRAMKFAVEDQAFSFSHINEAFDWSSLDKPGFRLVDLGGGYGQVSQDLFKRTNHLKFTIQDLPHVVESGREKLPAVFEERISFEAHNFLEPQNPERKANAYLISRCLHNWSDLYCSKILRALIPGLKKGSKILIWDTILDSTPSKRLSDKFNLHEDFIMATISNGSDRTVEEMKRVLSLCDNRFNVEKVCRPEGSKLSLVQVSWDL